MKALGYFAVVTGKGKAVFSKDIFCLFMLSCILMFYWYCDFILFLLFLGSSAESIDSIKDYEEDFFQNSRLLKQVNHSSLY